MIYMTRLYNNRLSLSKLRNCYLQTDSLKVRTNRHRCGNWKKKTILFHQTSIHIPISIKRKKKLHCNDRVDSFHPSLNKNIKEKHEECIGLNFTCDVSGWSSSCNWSSFRQCIPRHTLVVCLDFYAVITAEPTCPARLRPAIHIHPLFLFLTMLQASEPRAMRQSTRHWLIHIRLS